MKWVLFGTVIVVLLLLLLLVPWLMRKRRRTVAVVSACTDMSGIVELCNKHSIELLIFDKCGNCESAPKGVKCVTRKNVGREQETYLSYVVDNYNNLPDDILFVALPLEKYSRGERIEDMIKNNKVGCEYPIGDEKDFVIDEWGGLVVEPASVRPFKAWFEKFVGPWDDNHRGVCWNGIMKTTKERILQKPVSFYKTLLDELSTHNSPEAGHYMERCMGNVF